MERQEELEAERQLQHLNYLKQEFLEKRRLYDLICSDLQGFYEEIDKLTKKTPIDVITDLQLEIVNDLIEMIKKLITEDEIVSKVNKFVAAGDNPAYRDVIVILKRLSQSMERFNQSLMSQAKSIIDLAKTNIPGEKFQSVADINLKNYFDRETFVDPSIYDEFK